MKLTEDDWYKYQPKTKMPIMLDEIKLSLTIIKKEYAGWLGVTYYPNMKFDITIAGCNYANK